MTDEDKLPENLINKDKENRRRFRILNDQELIHAKDVIKQYEDSQDPFMLAVKEYVLENKEYIMRNPHTMTFPEFSKRVKLSREGDNIRAEVL